MNHLSHVPVTLAMVVAVAWCGTGHADVDVDDLILLDPNPLAPRGGVLMVKVASTGETSGWSPAIDVILVGPGEPEHLVGHLGWIEQESEPANRSWSWNGNNLIARPIKHGDDLARIHPEDPVTGAYLLVELPADAEGNLVIGGNTYVPRWFELPHELPNFSIRQRTVTPDVQMEFVNAPNRPAADDPFTWWRWTLLADRLGMQAPSPPSSTRIEELVARNIEQLWRIGFTRLAEQSRGVASRCRDLLTDTSRDGNTEFALWITEQGAILQLVQVLLDPEHADKIDEHALAWADYQVTEVVWVEQAYGAQINLALATSGTDGTLAELIWHDRGDTPIGIRLAPGRTQRVAVDRPPRDIISDYYPELDMNDIASLNIIIHDHVLTMTFGPGTIPVKPPGALLGPFQASLTLAGGRAPVPIPVLDDRITYAQLRKFNNRWELFLECLRPGEAATNIPLTGRIRSLDAILGTEAVTILIGNPSSRRVPARFILCIPEYDDPIILAGPREELPEIHVRSYSDRWLARCIIPDEWLPREDEHLDLALIRTHGDTRYFESAPNACVPWHMNPDKVSLDLSGWDDGGHRP